MEIISETYKKRLQELAGIKQEVLAESVITEAITDADRNAAFALDYQRVPYNKDMMIIAIKEGREVAILFQSNNSKYKMPTSKYRIIYPVALGISKAGNSVIRGFHVLGQSESEAIRTGKRSMEIENTWRLFKVSNIKSQWYTGRYFRGPLEAYNAQDKSMISVEVAANFNQIIKYQDDMIKQAKNAAEQEQKRKNIVSLFKKPTEQQQQTTKRVQNLGKKIGKTAPKFKEQIANKPINNPGQQATLPIQNQSPINPVEQK